LFTLYDSEEQAAVAAQEIGAHVGVRAISVPLAPKLDDDLTR
jgi:hypothetical protein